MIPILLDELTKTYGSATNITMNTTIEAGELFTLLGPSGCGKSTLLRMIAGFVKPSSGRILFGDREVTHAPPNVRDTGMVFQNYALFPHMTVAENTAYGLKARKVPKQEHPARIEKALAQVGLTGYGDRRIDAMSGGQQQRVALARAIVIEPSVLLLDEPLSNLDAKLREETRAEIRRVQSDARITAVYVTHDQAEAMAMSDRIAVLDAGRVHQIDTPHNVYHRPATEFVARFIGRSNVVPATVAAVNGGAVELRLAHGARIQAPAPDIAVATGDEVSVSLRPETLGFVAAGEGLFSGTVREVEFTGASCRFVVDIDADSVIEVTAAYIPAAPAVGDTVSIGLTSGNAWVVRK